MKKPKKIKYGDRIGLIAPASPTTPEKVFSAKEALEALGFSVQLGKSCLNSYGYLAGSDIQRADDVNEMFYDPRINGIMCLRGGYGTPRILNLIDYEMIKSNPKVFIGYSDITALHISFLQESNLVTFHGPMAASDLIDDFDSYSREHLLRNITDSRPIGKILNPKDTQIKCLIEGQAEGILVGGNLTLLCSTMGTPYEVDTKGKILLLEDIGDEPYRIDRMLTQLALAGKLQDAEGFVLGDWKNCDSGYPEDESLSLMEVFEEILMPFKKPTIYNVMAGHCNTKMTLPFGVRAKIDAVNGILSIIEGAVAD